MQKPSKDKTTVKVEGTTEIGTSGAHVPSWELELKLGMELELGMWMGMRSWDGVWGCGAWPEFCLSWRTVSGSAFYDTHMHIHVCTYGESESQVANCEGEPVLWAVLRARRRSPHAQL